jgi:hypothetical protein
MTQHWNFEKIIIVGPSYAYKCEIINSYLIVFVNIYVKG